MAKKKDLPAMPFYIGDWKKDPALQCLSREGKMIWLELIFLMWESSERGYLTLNSKPMPSQMIGYALNLDNQNCDKWITLFEDLGLFSRRENDGAIYSRKIVKIVELSEKRKNTGSLGGNPFLVNQKKTKKNTKGKPIAENETLNENEVLILVLNEEGVQNAEIIQWPTFDDFWNAYDKKVDRKVCEPKWDKLEQSDKEKIMQYIPSYILSQPDKKFRKDPETFLNRSSWENEIIISNGKDTKSGNGNASREEIAHVIAARRYAD